MSSILPKAATARRVQGPMLTSGGPCHASLSCLAICLVALLAPMCCNADTIVEGELNVFTVHLPADLDGDSFYLDVPKPDGQGAIRNQLLFKAKPVQGSLMTGDKLSIRVRDAPPQVKALAAQQSVLDAGDLGTFQVDEFNVTERSAEQNFNNPFVDGTVDISSIVFLTKICGKKSVTDVNAFKRRWNNVNNPSASGPFSTMENYYKTCSKGKASFPAKDNIIVDLTDFNIPCTGTWQKQAFTSTKCGAPEIFGWMEAAKEYVLKVKKIDYNKYARWILVMPDNSCPWAGLASVGCGKNCFTWLKSSYAVNTLSTSFHELGHNLGLQHSITPGNEYGDGSAIMGGCCGERCFNAPHQWQIKWAQPIAVLNATTLPVGRWREFTIPALPLSSSNHIQVVPTWRAGAVSPAFFLSFRQPIGSDVNVGQQYLGGISVHVFNGTQAVGPFKTELQGVVSQGAALSNTIKDVVVRHVKNNATHATISVCRYSSSRETNCGDDADEDCNGLIDAADPACAGRVPPRPPGGCNNNGVCEGPRETFWSCPSDCRPVCGDGVCIGGETAESCPSDCPAVCGDCYCDEERGETSLNCPKDCPPVCGDGYCDYARGENAQNCPNTKFNKTPIKGDCPAVCGDGFCDSQRHPWESAWSCPQDCRPRCGDGSCMQQLGETSMNCRADCPVRCGDRFCDTSAGEQRTCPRDCPARLPPPNKPPPNPSPRKPYVFPPPCTVNASAFSPPPPFPPGSVIGRAPPPPGGSRSPSPRLAPLPAPRPSPRPRSPSPRRSPSPVKRSPSPRTKTNPSPSPRVAPLPAPRPRRSPPPRPRRVPSPKHTPRPHRGLIEHALLVDSVALGAFSDPIMLMEECGDGRCRGSETAANCPSDCPPLCGDGFCDKTRGERPGTCLADCPPETCGDGVCGATEVPDTCAVDCCPVSKCGDGVCQAYGGENCLTCPQDCAGSVEDGFCCGAYFSCLDRCSSNGKQCLQTCSHIQSSEED